jgi:DNA-binding response OmpR family regulator
MCLVLRPPGTTRIVVDVMLARIDCFETCRRARGERV